MSSQLFSTSEGPRAAKSPIILLAALIILLLTLIPVVMFNQALFSLLNGLYSRFTDLVWLAFTTLGDGLLLGIILGAFLLVNPRVTVLGLLVMILSSVVVHLVKAAYPSLRPVELLQSVHVVGPLLRSGSFPSGHAAASMSAGLAIAHFCSSRLIGAVVMGIAGLIGVSRIFVGAHFPADVLGGMICALGVFLIFTLTVWPALEKHVPESPSLSRRRFRVAFGAEVLAVLFALFVHAPYRAALPSFAAFVVLAVLVFLALGYLKLRAKQV
jgi:membrane-associated phospholipid phosphatase